MENFDRAFTTVNVVNGHLSSDSAFVVDDYPYGSLRCEIRFWIETATAGAKKGQQRFMSQTSNPKRPATVWNKPKPHRDSTYAPFVVMYLDSDEHVDAWTTSHFPSPVDDARMRLLGIYDQLTDTDRARYRTLLNAPEAATDQRWADWAEKKSALMDHITATGSDPEVHNGIWTTATHRWHLGWEQDVALYVAAARAALNSGTPSDNR